MSQPLVSVICLCYNHAPYLIEALNSVEAQDYDPIELIIVDDCSSDNSAQLISEWIKDKDVKFLKNETNIGNTKSFNRALNKANGFYIVDFATDDVLLPNSISEKVNTFHNSNYNNVGVVFSNVEYIDTTGNFIKYEYDVDRSKKALKVPKTGMIYKDLVSDYFISASSMLIKKEVFNKLNGYDESLAYEDLDFWFRSSREFEYDYTDKILLKKRITNNSLGKQFYSYGKNKLSKSTYKVCLKALKLNRSKEEHLALLNRLKYEIKLAARKFNIIGLLRFLSLWLKTKWLIFRSE